MKPVKSRPGSFRKDMRFCSRCGLIMKGMKNAHTEKDQCITELKKVVEELRTVIRILNEADAAREKAAEAHI